KLKKQNNRPQFDKKKKGSDKEREAIERMRKEALEKSKKIPSSIVVPAEIQVNELAAKLHVTNGEVVKKLIGLGVMASVNQMIDFDTAALVADEFGSSATQEVVVTIEERLFTEAEDSDGDLVPRAPVVCVMGHVDHGKTSLLDAIRHTNVTAGEAGGITQAIGAYRVSINGRDITFLDTPGHEAFTAMRARGAKSTDIAILVVAADDGIMPQTVEAINHAKAADIPIVVAINKMDKPHANPDLVKQGLTAYDLVPEEWGGDVICVPVSALTGMGIEELLENVLLVADMKELSANPNRRAKGLVLESRLDKGKGPVATVLVQNGTLHAGDVIIAGTAVGRVRAMTNDKGSLVKDAGPSVPVEITGLSEIPQAGDEFAAVEDERMARELADQRRDSAKEEQFKANARANLDTLFEQIREGVKDLNIVVKADVAGSVEAVKASLIKLSNEEVKVNVIHAAVGGITEGDVMLAAASNAIIVGFSVRPDKSALDSAEVHKVEIRTYRIIYECIDEIEAAIKGMLAPTYKEALHGHAVVRQTIHVPSVGTIAGSYIQDGKVTRSSQIRVLRDGIVIFEDKIKSLRRFKDDVREVTQGYECGIGLERFNDIKEGDVLEAFAMEEISSES
ncbi:MAG: translation initiation factor IF-2, partial [Clostridia bacterium]|nr:translation initiation factor IF-2 [Clostridia bacterium]